MTDAAQFSDQTRFEMALLERLQRSELTDERLREEFGLPPDFPLTRVELLEIDTELIHLIAVYLIEEEELGPEFDSSEDDRIINIGMFIYGWEESKRMLL